MGIVDFLLEMQKAGRIRHFGFSFHGSYEEFETILTARDWDFCQIQFNYMDQEIQAGMRGYALAEKLGVPIIVMEPVKGGSLATLSDDITAKFKAAPGLGGRLVGHALGGQPEQLQDHPLRHDGRGSGCG